ncbi:MAG: endopeptidase La [Candidatus Eremiobacteraeota bacterium]|nr:endopeptidase La [Candidatus Eremiobacteraeota bacterium]MBC5827359.1 endopeptidase La [Candidatus Eremiobacteraeota bacterium]
MAEQNREPFSIPAELAILPLQEAVLFPNTVMPLAVTKAHGIKLVEDALKNGTPAGVVALRERDASPPGPEDVYTVGTVAIIQKMIKVPDGTLRCIISGTVPFRVIEFTQAQPYLAARVEQLEEVTVESDELTALVRNLAAQYTKLLSFLPSAPKELELEVNNINDPNLLSYFVGSTMRLETPDKQAVLEERDTLARLRMLTAFLTRELEVLELGHKIQSDIQKEMDKNQREYYLRQQLKAIQDELGETDPAQADVNELREKIDAAKMPEDAHKAASRELDRLGKIPSASPEYSVIRTYLDWLVTLPWSVTTEDSLDIGKARKILDEDHYDLEKVKDRILEYLAVRKLKNTLSGPILCFVGPPGVGKTSLGKSIARAMHRKFVRLSVGGVRDEAEIRGHRRTYIGAMPGTFIRAIRDVGSANPLIMIDEIDKVGADFRGDPSSALLEVLDPEQNNSFRDHYLDLPFDLSKVLFIATANQLDTISPPLRDRMEIIALAGYTQAEKIVIARKYLVSKQLQNNGLTPRQCVITKDAIEAIVADYTREAGVRNLEREIATVCRKVARKIAEDSKHVARVTAKTLSEYLGKQRFFAEVAKRTATKGVATGLVWTPVGGDIVFVESSVMPGTGKLTMTGQLGDVMKESAQAALSFLRTRSKDLKLADDFFNKHDVHIHVPAGAVPKDGPSAGVAIATSLVSALTGRKVEYGVAMTGEITLTGQVLPVGGIKEKVLGARRAGIKRVVLPARNEPDMVEDVPADVRRTMKAVYVEELSQALKEALGTAMITPVVTANGRRNGRPLPTAAR